MTPPCYSTDAGDRCAVIVMLAAALWAFGTACTGTADDNANGAEGLSAVEDAISQIGDSLGRISDCSGIDQRLTPDQLSVALDQQYAATDTTLTFEAFVLDQVQIIAALADVQCGLAPDQDTDENDNTAPPQTSARAGN